MLKIYVGEDDPTQTTYLKRLLSRYEEVETHFFGDGLSLYQAVQANSPDFIISDNVLPKLDGLSIARLIKFHEKTQEIPFLLVSSIESHELPGFGECGADAFLPKPVRPKELKKLMERLFGELTQVQKT